MKGVRYSLKAMRKLILFFGMCLFGITNISAMGNFIDGKVNVKVTDEFGRPVALAKVEIGFKQLKSKGFGEGWGTVVDYRPSEGETNAKGEYSAKGSTSSNIVVTVTKDGFYESNAGVSFADSFTQGVIITLRKIKDPVPMYVNSTDYMNSPKSGEPIGFDLEVGDWVAPYGNGKVRDFIFNLTSRFESPFDSEVKYDLTFSSPRDGIQEYVPKEGEQSMFILPYKATEDSYLDEFSRYEFSKPISDTENLYKTDMKKTVTYLFRVRTIADAQGNIISANYGYISSEIGVGRFDGGTIQFSYYFNPDNKSRSLEYNGENLFNTRDKQGRKK